MSAAQVHELALAAIAPNPGQPRKHFPPEHIAALAASIEAHGLLQPILVRPLPGARRRYQIVAGECRFRAHQALGRATIAALIAELDDGQARVRAIVENMQRRDMSPIEEARGFAELAAAGLNAAAIARELALESPALVRNRLNLLKLDAGLQKLIDTGALSPAMGSAISWAPRHAQARVLRSIGKGALRTVEQVRHACMALRDADAQGEAFAAPKPSPRDRAALGSLERKIAAVAGMVAAGFKDGECVAGQRVDPDRVNTLADQLALIRKHVLDMEHALRRAAAQGELLA